MVFLTQPTNVVTIPDIKVTTSATHATGFDLSNFEFKKIGVNAGLFRCRNADCHCSSPSDIASTADSCDIDPTICGGSISHADCLSNLSVAMTQVISDFSGGLRTARWMAPVGATSVEDVEGFVYLLPGNNGSICDYLGRSHGSIIPEALLAEGYLVVFVEGRGTKWDPNAHAVATWEKVCRTDEPYEQTPSVPTTPPVTTEPNCVTHTPPTTKQWRSHWAWIESADFDDDGVNDDVEYLQGIHLQLISDLGADVEKYPNLMILGTSLGSGSAIRYAAAIHGQPFPGTQDVANVEAVVALLTGADPLANSTPISDYTIPTFFAYGQNEDKGTRDLRANVFNAPAYPGFPFTIETGYNRDVEAFMGAYSLNGQPVVSSDLLDAVIDEVEPFRHPITATVTPPTAVTPMPGTLLTGIASEHWSDTCPLTTQALYPRDRELVDDMLVMATSGHAIDDRWVEPILEFLANPTQPVTPMYAPCPTDEDDIVKHNAGGETINAIGNDSIGRALQVEVGARPNLSVCFNDPDYYKFTTSSTGCTFITAERITAPAAEADDHALPLVMTGLLIPNSGPPSSVPASGTADRQELMVPNASFPNTTFHIEIAVPDAQPYDPALENPDGARYRLNIAQDQCP